MKVAPCFIKTFKENMRDWKILILVIVFAPFFIYLMYMYMGDPKTSMYNVVVINNDNAGLSSGELINEWKGLKTDEGKPLLEIKLLSDTAAARRMIKNREADLFVTIPGDFSQSLQTFLSGGSRYISPLTNYGDQANVKYMAAVSFIDYLTFSYLGLKTGIEFPMNMNYEYAGKGKITREFDLYIPALLVLAIIMMLFTSGASIVREVEKDTITRLSLSRLTSAEFMTALSLNQIIIGLVCLFVTLLAAFSVGYKTSGSIPLLFLIGTVTCFSVISISFITACFIRTMFGLLTLGCFPFFILAFFSDSFMPLPKINMFRLAGNQVYLNDLLPTATATRAFNKILNYDSGFSDVAFEFIWITVFAVIYFLIGTWLFKRKYKY
jgi:ABC-2 type transport system permease protein